MSVDIILYNPVERNTMSTTHNMVGRSVQWRKKEWRRISFSSSLSIFLSFFFRWIFFHHNLSQQNWTIGRCYTVHFCAHRLSSSSLLLLWLLFNFVFIDCFVTYFCVFRNVSVTVSHFAYTHTHAYEHKIKQPNNGLQACHWNIYTRTVDCCDSRRYRWLILRFEIVKTLYSASMQRWLSSTGEENGVLVVAGPGLWNTRKCW